MSQNTVLPEVSRFLEDRKRAYALLLQCVTDACERVKGDLGPNVVSRIYGRDSKQGGEFFKHPAKIAWKVVEKRKVRPCTIGEITDIVGLTAVVQYPDQVGLFIDQVVARLAPEQVISEKRERVEKPGYFATHVDLLSRSASHDGLRCELQVKTMLHDAWSAKMHDLNYKPGGRIDLRLDAMMRVIANSLESIEVQSETLRDLITERWRIESGWRRAARHRLFEEVPAWLSSAESWDDGARALRERMVGAREDIEKAPADSAMLKQFVASIAAIKNQSLRQGWALAAYLGSLRHDTVHQSFALTAIDAWIYEASNAYGKNGSVIGEAEIWSAPLACYAVGDIDKAIEASRTLVSNQALPEEAQELLRWNLASFLIEREYFMPSAEAKRDEAKKEVWDLIVSCEQLQADEPSTAMDTRGMFYVSFADGPADVRKAIGLIERGLAEARPPEKEIAEAYYELNARLAWRRLLELENDVLAPVPEGPID